MAELITAGKQLDRIDVRRREVASLHQCSPLARRAADAHQIACRSYYGLSTMQWLHALPIPATVSLKQIWRLWRDVVAARQAVADLPDNTTARHRIDAVTARDRAEATYNCALRVFEGREPWSWDKHCNDGWRMRAPMRAEPTPMQRMKFKQQKRRSKASAFSEPYRKVAS
jgi:hypothetical protein